MIEFSGDKLFPRPRGEMFAKLTDMEFLSHCIPDAEGVSCPTPDEIVGTLKPALTFAPGKINLRVRLVEKTPETSIRYEFAGKGIGSSNTVAVTLQLVEEEGGTRGKWEARVTELGGLLKAVPKGLVTASAQKIIADVWSEVEAKLA